MASNLITPRLKNKGATVAAATSKKFSYLDHLAAELQIEIAKNLDKEALRSLRLVSASLAKNTFDVFAEQNFTNISCRFDTRSLENVRNISATPHFVRHVRTIEFCAASGYETELPWPGIVPETAEGRARTAIDMLLEDIFSNFAKSGSAKCFAMSTTEDVLLLALHTVAMALTASGHFVEELHCTIAMLYPLALNNGIGRRNYSPDIKIATAFARIAKHSWNKLRKMRFIYRVAGNLWPYVRSAPCLLIEAACSVQELTLQVPFYLLAISRYALTGRHNLRVLELLGRKGSGDFGDSELCATLFQAKHSLETLILEDITIYSDDDHRWKVTLDWLSNALSLRYLSCQNLQTTSSSGSSWLLLDGEGNSQFEVKGSAEEVKTGLSKLVAEVGHRLEPELDFSEGSDEEESS